jgi:hypothetical protein
VFTNYGFHYPLTVALLQMAFIAPVSYLVARPQLSLSLVKQLAPLAMVNVMNVVCGLIGGVGATGAWVGGLRVWRAGWMGAPSNHAPSPGSAFIQVGHAGKNAAQCPLRAASRPAPRRPARRHRGSQCAHVHRPAPLHPALHHPAGAVLAEEEPRLAYPERHDDYDWGGPHGGSHRPELQPAGLCRGAVQ